MNYLVNEFQGVIPTLVMDAELQFAAAQLGVVFWKPALLVVRSSNNLGGYFSELCDIKF